MDEPGVAEFADVVLRIEDRIIGRMPSMFSKFAVRFSEAERRELGMALAAAARASVVGDGRDR